VRRWSLWSSRTATGAGNSSRLVRAATGYIVRAGSSLAVRMVCRAWEAACSVPRCIVDDGGFLRCAGCGTLGRRSVLIPERLVPALKARLDGRSPDAQIS